MKKKIEFYFIGHSENSNTSSIDFVFNVYTRTIKIKVIFLKVNILFCPLYLISLHKKYYSILKKPRIIYLCSTIYFVKKLTVKTKKINLIFFVWILTAIGWKQWKTNTLVNSTINKKMTHELYMPQWPKLKNCNKIKTILNKF